MFVMTCTAGYLTGFRRGSDDGVKQKQAVVVTTQAYAVTDLIEPIETQPGWLATEQDFRELIDLITSTIAIDEWTVNGGDIQPLAANGTILVTCSCATHEDLAELLQQLRRMRYKLPDNRIEKVRELTHRRQPVRQIIKAFTIISPEVHRRMEGHFSSVVTELGEEFGKPNNIIAAGDRSFPKWIAAQRVAIWELQDGILYLALMDCKPTGEALVAGWWNATADAIGPVVLTSNR